MTDTARSEKRFAFGANWRRFLDTVDGESIAAAEQSLQTMLGRNTLKDLTFLDMGCGSGLFSLAARRLGAAVSSFDYDPMSVACTEELRWRERPNDPDWRVESGSILDRDYLAKLGHFDIVYSWGVIHHTGEMWAGLNNALIPLRPGGQLFIAIYNDQGWVSRYWTYVKRLYNTGPVGRGLMIGLHLPREFLARLAVRFLTGRLKTERGMTLWYDMLDWLGGYPFECASPAAIIGYYESQGLTSENSTNCGQRHGCNEYVFHQGH